MREPNNGILSLHRHTSFLRGNQDLLSGAASEPSYFEPKGFSAKLRGMSTATLQGAPGAAGSGAAGIVRQGWTEKKIASNPSVSVPVSCTQQATSAEAASNAPLSAAADRSSPPSPTSSVPHAQQFDSAKNSPPSLKRFKRSEEDEIEAGKKVAERGLAHRSTKSGSVMMDKDEEDELESPRRAPISPSSYQPTHAPAPREGSEFRRTERLPSIAHLDEQIHTPWYHSKRPGIDEGRRYSAHPLLDVPHYRRQASDLSSSSPRMSPFGRSSAVGGGGGGGGSGEGGSSSSSTSLHHHSQMRSPRSMHADDGRPTPTLPSPRSIVDDDDFYHHRPMAPHHQHHQHHQQQHPPSLLGRRSRVDFEEQHSSFRPSQVQGYPPASSSSSPSTSSLFFEAPNRKRSSPPAPVLPSISGLVRPSQAQYHRREEEDDEERIRTSGLQQSSPPSQQSRRKVSESDILPAASSPYSSHSSRLMGRSSNSSSVSNGSTITSSTLPTSRYEPRDESSFYPRPAPSYGSDPRAYASMTSNDSYRHRSSLPLTSRSYSAAYYPSAPAGTAAAAAAAAAAEAEASGVVAGKGRSSGGGNGGDVHMGEIPVRSISASYGGDEGGRPVFRSGGEETAYEYEMRRSSLLGPGGPSPSHRHIYHGPRSDAHPSPMMGTSTSGRRDDAAMSPVPASASTSGNPSMPSLSSSVAIPRRRGKLPKPVTDLLKSWLLEHASHPYPTEDEKRRLCSMTGLSISQVSNWFINARRRILVPQGSGTFAMGAGVGSNVPPGAGVETSDEQERMMLRPSVSPPPHHFHDRLHRHPHEHPDHHQHHPHRNPHHFHEEDSP